MNRKWFVVSVLAALVLTGCGLRTETEKPDGGEPAVLAEHQTAPIAEKKDIAEYGGREDVTVYDEDDPDSLVYFYVTVRRGSEAKGTDHSFSEVKSAVRFQNGAHVENDIFAEALVQVGDENGPVNGMLGYGETKSNATIRIRGNSSTTMPLKSYKLSLNDNAGLWRGQSNIALNKHAFDSSRLRNKLYFDLLREIPEVPGSRSQFARLFIKDETAGATEFEDYGVYTQIEVPTKKYLGNHGLDRSGYLYKAISFNFEPNEALKNLDDPAFDQKAFDAVLSCKGREDHTKLLAMIDRVNDTSLDINEVIDTYFDRDNYEHWLAYNILMRNIDTTVQNFYLYSPLASEKWYFIPWDSDVSLYQRERELKGMNGDYDDWECGISNYWGIILHQRFLKIERNREELAEKVEELHERFNAGRVQELAEEYNAVIEPYLLQMPDLLNLTVTREERTKLLSQMGAEIDENYELFQKSLEALMPFFEYAETLPNGDVRISWTDAYDFQAGDVKYRLCVSRYPDMRTPIYTEYRTGALEAEIPAETVGEEPFYYKVEAYTEDGRSVRAMDKVSVGDSFYPGVREYRREAVE